jgi:4'-phosphopantetheinyl transferase
LGDHQRLDASDVQVWVARLHQPPAQIRAYADTLSADELERAHRFHFERDQNSFIAARGVLRTTLGVYLGVEAALVEFTYGPHGKPALAASSTDTDLTFNLSHSEDLALVALTRGRPIGVDIERMKPFAEVADVPPSIFSPRELTEFRTLSPDDQQASFFNAWTRKEAFVKATGSGFSMSVKEVEVTFAPGQEARLVRLNGSEDAAAQWTLRDLPAPDGFKATVAVSGRVGRVLLEEWTTRLPESPS